MIITIHENEAPTRPNIKCLVEIKFGTDTFDDDQKKAYERIAGGMSKVVELRDKDCGCDNKSKYVPDPVVQAAWKEEREEREEKKEKKL